jgi:uncharacterized membrane protein
MKQRNTLLKISQLLGTIFIKGLITILPVALTIAIVNFSFKMLKGWLRPLYEMEPTFLKQIPFSEFLLAFVAILIIGTIVNLFVLQALITLAESVVFKIPLVRPIYSGIKQLVQAFNPHDVSFKKVVIIEFPRPGIYSIGFLTGEVNQHIIHPELVEGPDSTTKYFSVFVPTTPNPTTGFYFMVAEEKVRVINISRQEAMALIISGGIIQPERFEEAKP